jgi:hypothetical protein
MSLRHSIEEYKEALHKYRGGPYLTAEYLGVTPRAIMDRISKSPELQAIVELYRGRRTDVARAGLDEALMRREPWSIKFQLAGPGRAEGYLPTEDGGIAVHIHMTEATSAGADVDGCEGGSPL